MRNFIALIFVLSALTSFAQKKKKSKEEPPKQEVATPAVATPAAPATKPADSVPSINPLLTHYVKKLQLANRWGDQVAAKEALLDLIAETGNDSLAYTLAVYYYENQQYAPAVLISKDLLIRTPKNVSVLQISAAAFEGLGLKDKALPNYESIYMVTDNTAVLYKMVSLQYDTKRYAEAKTNIDILMTKTDLDSLKVEVVDGQKAKNYPVKVSIYNIKGLLALEAGDKVAARKAFQDALAIAPDYKEAKDNLAKLK